MSIGDAMVNYRNETGASQRQLSEKLHFDRSFIARVENGERLWPEAHDTKLAGVSWKLALSLADERTGGYISNIMEDMPNIDLHPSALKEIMLKELHEAYQSLGELQMAKHINPERRKLDAEKVWNELTDVIEFALIMRGVMEEVYTLDRDSLVLKHEFEVKRGER